MDMMGPRGQDEMDARMSALKSWQTPRATISEDEIEPLLKALLPLFASQAMDLASTEQGIRSGSFSEGNPMPGMKGLPGRLVYTLAEALLLKKLADYAPKVGRAAIKAKTAVHSGAAGYNWNEIQEEAGREARKRLMGKR